MSTVLQQSKHLGILIAIQSVCMCVHRKWPLCINNVRSGVRIFFGQGDLDVNLSCVHETPQKSVRDNEKSFPNPCT